MNASTALARSAARGGVLGRARISSIRALPVSLPHTTDRTRSAGRHSEPSSKSKQSRSALSRGGCGPTVEPDGCEQDRAHRDLLVERVEPEQDVAVADQGDEEHADDGAPDRALAAEDAGAADDDAGEHGEGERRVGGPGLRAEHPRGVDDAGQAGGGAADDERE